MSALSAAMRHKRFGVLVGSDIALSFTLKNGSRISARIADCSVSGLGATLSSVPQELAVGDLVDNAVIVTPRGTSDIKRLLVRHITLSEEGHKVGFSAIEARIPVNDLLSHFLKEPLNKRGSPFEYELSASRFSTGSFAIARSSSSDLLTKCRDFGVFFRDWSRTSRYLYESHRRPTKDARRTNFGCYDDMLVMGSNDYLGLASHPRVVSAAKAALDEYGFGSTGSPLTTGSTVLHRELCERLAKIFGKEKAILFNSGYAANIGALSGLLRQGDLVAVDQIAHASIHDGIMMSRAERQTFRHNDVGHLKRIFESRRASAQGALTITEGIFSMDGDAPPLDHIVRVSQANAARVYVDEAHSFGFMGPRGLGCADQFGLLDDVDLIMGTFSKICGAIGGFIAASADVCDWLYWFGRSQMFSVSLPPSTVAAISAALDIFQSEPDRLQRLQSNVRKFSEGLRQLGFTLAENHWGPIVPVIVGDEQKLGKMAQRLLDRKVFVVPVVYPAVSRNSCRFRFTLNSELEERDLAQALNAIEDAAAFAGVSR